MKLNILFKFVQEAARSGFQLRYVGIPVYYGNLGLGRVGRSRSRGQTPAKVGMERDSGG